MSAKEKDFLMAIRQALLMMIDAIERKIDIEPRTSQIRKELKRTLIFYQTDLHKK
jgi:hypothetical protein